MDGDKKPKAPGKWLTGPPSASKNPFKRDADFSLRKSLSSSAVGRSLKKSVSSSSLGKNLKRAASRLSLTSRDKSGSTVSVKNTHLLAPPDHVTPSVGIVERSTSAGSIGSGTTSTNIGEAVRVRFIWDHGGVIVYVCVMQNGIKKSYRLLKEDEGYHAANATLWAGRCEFR
jgi:hypothetical protein